MQTSRPLLFALAIALTVTAGLLAPWAASANVTMGRCSFSGNTPPSKNTMGTMQVWHNGTLTQTGTQGTQQIYEVKGGDVWVIYGDYGQKDRYVFRGGSVQTCDKNIP